MKLTRERITRYLKKQKQINDYFLKVKTSDRVELLKLTRICYKLLEAEQEMRELILSFDAEVK